MGKFIILKKCSTLISVFYFLVKSVEESLDSIAFDEAVRRVERGSKIVTAVMNGTAVILQV